MAVQTEPTTRKSARLDIRLTAEQKSIVQRAADLAGRSLSDFFTHAAVQAATETLRSHEVIELSARDSKRLVESLLNPGEPGPRLRRAAEEYKRARRSIG